MFRFDRKQATVVLVLGGAIACGEASTDDNESGTRSGSQNPGQTSSEGGPDGGEGSNGSVGPDAQSPQDGGDLTEAGGESDAQDSGAPTDSGGESDAQPTAIGLPEFTYRGVAVDSDVDNIFPSIIKAPDHISNPLNTYYMYTSQHGHNGVRLSHSSSLDGPWIDAGEVAGEGSSAAPHVKWIADEGALFMWNHHVNAESNWYRSTDGVNWTFGGLAIQASAIGTHNSTYTKVYEVAVPSLGNKYIMLYVGANKETKIRSVYLAHSKDAKTWTQLTTPVVDPATGENDEIYDPAYLPWGGKRYIVYQDNTSDSTGGDVKAVEINDNFDPVGTGGTRHLLFEASTDFPDRDRIRSTEFVTSSDRLYMFYEAGPKYQAVVAWATADLPGASP